MISPLFLAILLKVFYHNQMLLDSISFLYGLLLILAAIKEVKYAN